MSSSTKPIMNIPDYNDVLVAHERIKPYIHETPVLTSRFLNNLVGAELFFKCEKERCSFHCLFFLFTKIKIYV